MTKIETQTPGNMWKVLVKVGDQVKVGDTLFIMEVMKTEVPHNSEVNGVVEEVNVQEGQENIEAGFVAVVIK